MRTRNQLMTLALAVVCGVSIIATPVKAETMYDEAEDGDPAYEDEEVITLEQSADENSSDKFAAPAGDEQKEQVQNFVSRLYQVILNREADEDGLNAWTGQLLDRTATGAQIVGGFVESDEFTQRGLTNEEVVEIMYQAMLGRASDEGGKAGWSKILNNGCSYLNIVNGFSGSAEFIEICESYGITAGTVELNRQRDKNPQLTAFVARCYTQALGRQYETDGLESWCDVIISGRNTPKQAAQNFIFSDEFTQKNLNSEEYVKVLYRTFMGREADEGGLAAWVEVLESGREDRAKVLEGFSDSAEFDEILQSFGLDENVRRVMEYYSGKKVTWYGDSLTQLYLHCEIVDDYFRFAGYNSGISSTLITNINDSSLCMPVRMHSELGDGGIADVSDIIIIMAGTNDWVLNIQPGDVEREFQNMKNHAANNRNFSGACHQMFFYLKEFYPNARIIVLGTPYSYVGENFFKGADGVHNELGLTSADYGDILCEAASLWGIENINIGRCLGWNKNNIYQYTLDGIHFNPDEGCNAVAGVIIDYLKRLKLS